MNAKETLCQRRERRFKTSDDQSLRCDTNVSDEELVQGAVIDISPGGLRLLCEGNFSVGQTFCTELKTERSHGTYRGVIRRLEPWMAGQSILGCELLDPIPAEILETLAQQGIVNRRSDDRACWNQSGKISWELQPGEFDVEIHDCSPGGLKLSSQTCLPDDLRLRIRVDVGEEEPIVVDAKTVWQLEQDNGVLAGLAFTKREVPEAITRILGNQSDQSESDQPAIRQSILVAAAAILLSVAIMQTGWWG